MVEIVISVAAKVAEYLVDPIIRPLGYLFNYHRNITDFNQRIEMLDHATVRLQQSVEEANRQGDEIFPDVEEWLKGAQGIIQKREDFIEDEKKASKSRFYLKSRYQLSKQAKKQAGDIVVKIQQADTFYGRVSHPPPPPPLPFISSASFNDSEAFQSRESTFNQIMEALRNEDMSMIGVWGMGGVGKTTLVKHVAKLAVERKLFHKVVMASNISQTPNIEEIQGKIASTLDLKFEAGKDRAVSLRQSLKNQEKILVILDDIWGKLNLGEIGIPYGDDHKGCKVLLTSRERQALSKDMRTQKEFHLQHLSEEEAWNLFKKTAGDSVEKLELHSIAVDVAKKCEGLPVAIVTIANALRDERVGVWENALEELRRSAPTSIRGVSKNVYLCLELSYNHLEGDEVKSLFLLCALLGDGDIFMDRLLQHAMGLNLFEGLYSWEKAANKLTTLVENLKASSLLLESEDEGNHRRTTSLFFDRDGENIFVRMHDVVRDVARSIAFKDPRRFVVKEAVGLQEEWQWMDECRNCTCISLKCKNIDELPQGLLCPKLEFFLLDSSNDDGSYLKIPDTFFQDTKQLRVLDLSKVSLAPSPSSLGFPSNLRTLCLNHCWIQDIAVIGDLRTLQVLSLAESKIEQLPKEMMQLSDLRVLDLQNCDDLKVIPRNVISSLSRLEYLSMEGCSRIKWEKEGFNSGERINNACVSELKHLSCLRTLEVQVRDPSLLPEDDVLFDNLNLTRYAIEIGIFMSDVDVYKASRRLMLNEVKRLHMVNCSKLLKRSQVLGLQGLNDTKDVVYELDKEGFVELKYLYISCCPSIQYILHSNTSVEWAPRPNTFCLLEQLELMGLNNLEAVCHGPIPMGFFGNLRSLRVYDCERLKYVLSLPSTQHGRESLAFPQLQKLTLWKLPEVISFYSIGRSSGSEESMTFFNQQTTFPSLEILRVDHLDNVRALCHNQLPTDSFPKLRVLHVTSCNKLLNIFPSNNLKGLQSLQILTISKCRSIQYILHSSTSVEWAPPPMLEYLEITMLGNLKAVCDGPIPMGFFGNLRILSLEHCQRLKYVFSLPSTQHGGRESLAFPQLQQLRLRFLRVVISFYSIGRSSGSEESVTFFNQQATFPTLESLHVERLDNVTALWHDQLPADSFPKLKKLEISLCNKLLNIFPSNNLKGLQRLQILTISECRSIQYILHSSTSVEWAPPPNTFCMLEKLELVFLFNLEAVCDGPIPMGFFGNLRFLSLWGCERLKYVFSLPSTQDGRESLAFPQLQEMKLEDLPEVISFYSIGRSSGNEESVTFFNQQVAFLALETLDVQSLDNVRALWQNQLPAGSFSKLKKLEINSCNKLLNVFPLSMAKVLVQLEDLEIQSCEVLEAIVANENEAALLILFPKLTSLVLDTLPQLKSFCSGRFTSKWPLLKKLKVRSCDKVEIFLQEIGLEGELDNKIQQPLFLVEKEAFPNLEELSLTLKGTMEIWRGQFSRVLFSKLRVLNVIGCHGILVVISSSMVQILHNLERLEVDTCYSVNEVIQVERLLGEEFHVETLPRLTEICLKNLPRLMHLSRSGLYFENLQTLEINSCGSWINLATLSMAKRMSQLKTLIMGKCHILKEIVGNEGDEPTNEIDFTRLQRLELVDLPNLESFCSARYTFQFPSLEIMEVIRCPKMEFFCKGVLDTPRLRGVQMADYLFAQKCWEGDLNTTIHKKFMEQNA